MGSLPACGDDKKTSDSATEATSDSATTASTGAPTTSGATETTGEPADCEKLPDMAACDAEAGCTYSPEFGACIFDCAQIHDLASCNMHEYCSWSGDTCELVLE